MLLPKRTGTLVSRAVQYKYRITNASKFNGNGGNEKILRPIPQTVLDLIKIKNSRRILHI